MDYPFLACGAAGPRIAYSVTKIMDYPFAKIPILWVFETDLFVVQKGLLAI